MGIVVGESFCIDAGLPYFFITQMNQTYDDTETFVAMQGNNSVNSDTVCSISSDLDGTEITADCAPSKWWCTILSVMNDMV